MLDYLDKALSLQKAGQPFALATVVRAEKPTSAKAGAKAIVTADGALTGWVGGSCAQPTVIREALKALQDGQPRLVRLCPPERLGRASQDGVIEVALTCISGGTFHHEDAAAERLRAFYRRANPITHIDVPHHAGAGMSGAHRAGKGEEATGRRFDPFSHDALSLV